MSIRTLIFVSGSCVAIGFATALAQQDTTRTPQTTTQPDRYPATPAADDIENLLRKRQGVWQVDVVLDSQHWSRMHGATTVDQRYITMPGERSPDRTEPPAKDPAQPGNAEQPGSFPWKDDPQRDPARDQPEQNAQPGITTQDGKVHMRGYAETSLVLDDRILQERMVMPTGDPVRARPSDPGNTKPEGQEAHPGTMPQEGFRGISLIEFNGSDRTYDMVFLCNMSEGIRYESGYFDAQRNRVVFRGASDGMSRPHTTPAWDPGRTEPARQPDPRDPSTPRPSEPLDPSRSQPTTDPSSTPPGQPGAERPTNEPGMDDIVVVLEFVDDNTHKVTMYDTSRGLGAGPDQDGRNPDDRDDLEDRDEPGDIDDRDDADRDDDRQGVEPGTRQPADSSPRTPAQPTTHATEFGAVIYEATYTRAPSTMEARIRSIIDESITVASR